MGGPFAASLHLMSTPCTSRSFRRTSATPAQAPQWTVLATLCPCAQPRSTRRRSVATEPDKTTTSTSGALHLHHIALTPAAFVPQCGSHVKARGGQANTKPHPRHPVVALRRTTATRRRQARRRTHRQACRRLCCKNRPLVVPRQAAKQQDSDPLLHRAPIATHAGTLVTTPLFKSPVCFNLSKPHLNSASFISLR
jgi:hypothetical protein